MKVEELTGVVQEEIKRELDKLKKGIKEGYISKRQKLTRELLAVYGHLTHGGKIIDLVATFHKTGLRKTDLPKMGIIPANAKYCYLYKQRNGGAIFSNERKDTWRGIYAHGTDIELPPDTFNWKDLDNTRYQTLAPIIPPRIHVEIACRIIPQEYHILYEVNQWSKSTPPKDPILGKMLTKTLFGVLATWELTDLESKIISGRI